MNFLALDNSYDLDANHHAQALAESNRRGWDTLALYARILRAVLCSYPVRP